MCFSFSLASSSSRSFLKISSWAMITCTRTPPVVIQQQEDSSLSGHHLKMVPSRLFTSNTKQQTYHDVLSESFSQEGSNAISVRLGQQSGLVTWISFSAWQCWLDDSKGISLVKTCHLFKTFSSGTSGKTKFWGSGWTRFAWNLLAIKTKVGR